MFMQLSLNLFSLKSFHSTVIVFCLISLLILAIFHN
uniref:Uncharacterized protein n=1 Tax=Rhizophora mucronata TaxID=61149 RepID=A0A2P2QQN3_RHIMU